MHTSHYAPTPPRLCACTLGQQQGQDALREPSAGNESYLAAAVVKNTNSLSDELTHAQSVKDFMQGVPGNS